MNLTWSPTDAELQALEAEFNALELHKDELDEVHIEHLGRMWQAHLERGGLMDASWRRRVKAYCAFHGLNPAAALA